MAHSSTGKSVVFCLRPHKILQFTLLSPRPENNCVWTGIMANKKIRTTADFFVGPDAKQTYGKPDVPTTFQLCRFYQLFEKERGHGSQEPEPDQSCPQHEYSLCNSSDSARHLMFWSCVGITLHWISPERLLIFTSGHNLLESWGFMSVPFKSNYHIVAKRDMKYKKKQRGKIN